MLRQIAFLFVLAWVALGSARAAIWPEEFFGYKRVAVSQTDAENPAVWEEYGFEEGETARYRLEGKEFTATAWRFADSTGAMAVFEWQQPPKGRPSELTKLALEWDDGAYFSHGNYIFRFYGYRPTEEQVVGMLLVTPMLEQSPLPTWVAFVPEENRIRGTERFVVGPVGLETFEPRVPPSVAGFHYGVEAQFAEYRSPKGKLKLGVFSYPTPHIARERLAEFRMLPDVIVKRSGPLVAVVFGPADSDEAEKLLAKVNYRYNITWDEFSIPYQPTIIEIVLTAFLFIGGLLLAALLLGGIFGGLKFWRWRRQEVPEDPMIMLHLEDR